MFLTQTILRQNAHPSGKPRRAPRRNGAKNMNFGPALARCPDHQAASQGDHVCLARRAFRQARRLACCVGPDCPRRQRDDPSPRRCTPVPPTMTRRAASAAPAHGATARHRPAKGRWRGDCVAGPACPARGRRARSPRRARPARPGRSRANALASTVLTRGSPGRPARLTQVANPKGRDARVTEVDARWPVLLFELGCPLGGACRASRDAG